MMMLKIEDYVHERRKVRRRSTLLD